MATSIKSGDVEHPEGAAILKETYSAENKLDGWAVMTKTQATSIGNTNALSEQSGVSVSAAQAPFWTRSGRLRVPGYYANSIRHCARRANSTRTTPGRQGVET